MKQIELAKRIIAVKRQMDLEEYLAQHLKELNDLKFDDLSTRDYAFLVFEEKELDHTKLDKMKKAPGSDTSGIA